MLPRRTNRGMRNRNEEGSLRRWKTEGSTRYDVSLGGRGQRMWCVRTVKIPRSGRVTTAKGAGRHGREAEESAHLERGRIRKAGAHARPPSLSLRSYDVVLGAAFSARSSGSFRPLIFRTLLSA